LKHALGLAISVKIQTAWSELILEYHIITT